MSSIQQKPKTVTNTLNSILLSWESTFSNTSGPIYHLQIQTEFGYWRHVYWGKQNQFNVQSLAPCTAYSFRIKCFRNETESDWLHFKSATETVQYFVMHVTRAVQFGDTSVIRKIITNKQILLEAENKEGKTPLMQAIEQEKLQIVTFLLNVGANVNHPTLITKRTPLMIALSGNNLQISGLLLNKGADISAVDCNKLTALHYAVDSNICDNVLLCLNHKFNINASDNKGWTPLLRGVVLNCTDEILLLLLEHGADHTVKDNSGFDFNKHLQMSERIITIPDENLSSQ